MRRTEREFSDYWSAVKYAVTKGGGYYVLRYGERFYADWRINGADKGHVLLYVEGRWYS